jgi:hypothetical protein
VGEKGQRALLGSLRLGEEMLDARLHDHRQESATGARACAGTRRLICELRSHEFAARG